MSLDKKSKLMPGKRKNCGKCRLQSNLTVPLNFKEGSKFKCASITLLLFYVIKHWVYISGRTKVEKYNSKVIQRIVPNSKGSFTLIFHRLKKEQVKLIRFYNCPPQSM